MMWLRHLTAVALLPFTVAVLVPLWLAGRFSTALALGDSALALAAQLTGAALLALEFTLFASSLRRFAREGQGTLAPWDPPRALVITGPYRYVRNPMIWA
jgi:protein-S-isoprenylcysteine O-methyltransferase Ste14